MRNKLRIIATLISKRLNILFGGMVDEYKDILSQQRMREVNAAQILKSMEAVKERQAACNHYHSPALGGHTYATLVEAENGPYMYCQNCQVHIRPSEQTIRETRNVVYDSYLFNRLKEDAKHNGDLFPFASDPKDLTYGQLEAANEMSLEELRGKCNGR